MSERTYTPEQIEEMRTFEAIMWLKDLKAGDVVTERNMEGLNRLLGGTLERARALKPKAFTINFTKEGQPYTTDGNPLGISIDGKVPMDLVVTKHEEHGNGD